MKKNKYTLMFAALISVGAALGFVYWKTIGCTSGTCPITSQWHWTTLYGAFFGYVIADTVKGILKRRESKKNSEG